MRLGSVTGHASFAFEGEGEAEGVGDFDESVEADGLAVLDEIDGAIADVGQVGELDLGQIELLSSLLDSFSDLNEVHF